MKKNNLLLKGHPLEGDGNLINLYHYLWKKNKDLESCPDVLIPDTIVYEHNFPRGWYCYDKKHKELRKKTGKDLDTKKIFREFSKEEQRSSADIVASYLSKVTTEDGKEQTSVEFFDRNDLDSFLFKRTRREHGILQKFIQPKGAHNSVIQAIWSPHVTLVERRHNTRKLDDTKYSMYERAVTYEGPAHYSSEVFCSPQLVEDIKGICKNIVQHFVSTEHKVITRMVLYFKVDCNSKVWLLWSSSSRISDKVTTLNKVQPLNLSPNFCSPEENKSSVIKPVQTEKTQADRVEMEISTSFICPDCSNEVDGIKYSLPLEKVINYYRSLSRKHRKSLSPSGAPSAIWNGISQSDEEYAKDPLHPSILVSSDVEGESNSDLQQRECIEDALERLDELVYEAYSHFLHTSEVFYFKMPKEIEITFSKYMDFIKDKFNIHEDRKNERSYIPYNIASVGKMHSEYDEFKKIINKEHNMMHQPYRNSSTPSLTIQTTLPIIKSSKYSDSPKYDPGDDRSDDKVPAVLKKFLPDLTNSSYRYLCSERLFLSRNIELCEKCFLKFTQNETNSPTAFHRSLSLLKRRRSTISSAGSIQSSRKKSDASRLTPLNSLSVKPYGEFATPIHSKNQIESMSPQLQSTRRSKSAPRKRKKTLKKNSSRNLASSDARIRMEKQLKIHTL